MKLKHPLILFHYFIGFSFLYPLIFTFLIGFILKITLGASFILEHPLVIDDLMQYSVYILVFMLIFNTSKSFLVKEFKKFKESFNPILFDTGKYFIYLYATSFIINIFIFLLIGENSLNQQSIQVAFDTNPFLISMAALIFAPFVEEMVFRGSIYNLSKRYMNPTLAAINSGLLFGLLHVYTSLLTGQYVDLVYLLSYGTMGYFLGKCYETSNNIYAPMLVHFINNFIAIVLMLMVG
ncbi:MAG: type II CAAX endopeptidase family protein [Erysipelotrichaceae bacterium]